MVARDETAGFGGIDARLVQEAGRTRSLDEPADLLMPAPEPGVQEGLSGVAERSVPDVVEEGGGGHRARGAGIEPELGAESAGEVHRPERVLEAGVVRAGVDEIGEAELPDLAEALEERRVQEREQRRLNLDIAVDRVADRLCPRRHRISLTVPAYKRSGMIAVLSGGTGTPKLLRGLRRRCDDGALAVVVNTGEDCWVSGGHLSPDADTVLYLCSGLLNEQAWWGIAGDTFACHEALSSLGEEEVVRIGDRDRAVQLLRGELLRRGATLTEATAVIAGRLGVGVRVLPMADDPYATHVLTEHGLLHFQEWWVRHRGALSPHGIAWRPALPPPATPEVLETLLSADAVIIGPSNPVTSIGPILACSGVREALADAFVVAVSPFIGDAPVSGPAGALMAVQGLEPTSRGVFALYADFCDVFVQDIRDTIEVPGSVRTDTLMVGPEESEALARVVLDLARP